MPDWSYRTVLRPVLLATGPERARRLTIFTLGTLSRVPFGLAAIDFLGHMRADPRLRTDAGAVALPGPIALGSLIDPAGEALPAFSRFGVGLLEVGPVGENTSAKTPEWRVDLKTSSVIRIGDEIVADVESVARSLDRTPANVPVCVRIAQNDTASIQRIVRRLESRATLFSIDASNTDEVRARIAAATGPRPVLLRIDADSTDAASLAHAAMDAGAVGVWLFGELDRTEATTRSLRAVLPAEALIVAGGVIEPDSARRLLDAGTNVAVVDAGLICSGPGLVKRCNEALLSRLPASAEPEPFSLDAARRSWFWAFLLGLGMFFGGVLAAIIASTRVVLPYDEMISGMTRAQLTALNPRLLPFMTHDRVSLAGTMISIGIFYAALAWFGIRRGAHWAYVTVIASASVGFFTFFFFLGFGYFDPFHAFVTAILTQFTLLCMTMQASPPQPLQPEWRESPAWRRGLWGQLIFILIGAGLTGAGLVISFIGCTSVFVETDLEFMHTTATQLRLSYERLVPLVAHDRASLGGMLIANGVAIWLSAQWGFRAGASWLWNALAWGGNLAFALAVAIHVVVGYHSPLHLAPAMAGLIAWNGALALTRGWLTNRVA